MPIQNIPQLFLKNKKQNPELYIHDFKMTEDVVKSKVNLTLHMFSFLQTGQKKVQLEDAFIEVNNKQSVLIKSGNCLMTELLDKEQIYFCKLFSSLRRTLLIFRKASTTGRYPGYTGPCEPFFVIENDDFIHSFVASISSILKLPTAATASLLAIKFEEIMLYLSYKYGSSFLQYIRVLALSEHNSSFRKIVEANVHTNLSLPEIAFLTNRSLSTFKRHFLKEFQVNPGKWFQERRLSQAKRVLDKGIKRPSEIFADYGYNSLSNFSIAFKNEFGYSPKNSSTADLQKR